MDKNQRSIQTEGCGISRKQLGLRPRSCYPSLGFLARENNKVLHHVNLKKKID
jgi:hypothetical protein